MIPDLANRALSAVVGVMGEPITITRGQVGVTVDGVFQASHVMLDPETGVQVRSTQPVVLVNRSDMTFDPAPGDFVEARLSTYRVRDAQPDGHTGWLLMLHKIQPGVS